MATGFILQTNSASMHWVPLGPQETTSSMRAEPVTGGCHSLSRLTFGGRRAGGRGGRGWGKRKVGIYSWVRGAPTPGCEQAERRATGGV